VTRELVDKMRNNFQMLDSCAFRFEYSGPGSILEIAGDAAAKTIIPKEHAAQPFRFMDLPNEIKEMILKEVLVNRWDSMRLSEEAKNGYIYLPRIIYFPQLFDPSHKMSCCSDCSTHFARGCSCVSRSSYSTSCACFTSPVPIFLTSKFMYSMASYVFFTRNTFAFDGHPCKTISIISKIPQKHVQLIRRIVMYIKSTCAMDGYVHIAKFMCKKFDLTRLTLNIEHDHFSKNHGSSKMLVSRFKMLIARLKETNAKREDANA
jgi:hypothetical protein